VSAAHAVPHVHTADRFVPLLWTIFFFVLFCNLMGMLPWLGAPTGTFSVTLGLAAVSIGASILFGKLKFGFFGFWANQVPQMDLPIALAVLLKPMIFLIEVAGFFIKHGVLAIRLLANMVAGHLVLLAIMMLAFSAEGARSEYWSITAVISVLASTAFSLLELFVAFLQAYLFTFLTALFIGAATSRH
jgi:F-type H+-transporting ATPase subunit a